MAHFVILEHDHPELHWDFMLEVGPALKTWRLAQPPERHGEPIEALPLPDHRLAYLDYEGPVSGGRGQVKRWDAGLYENLATEIGLTFHVRLHGSRLQGQALMKPTTSGWVFQIEPER